MPDMQQAEEFLHHTCVRKYLSQSCDVYLR